MDSLSPEEQRRIFFWDSPFPYLVLHTDCDARTSQIVSSNPAFQKLLGYTATELRGQKAGLFVHPSDIKPLQDEFAKLCKGENGHIIYGYLKFLHKDLSEGPIPCDFVCWRSPESGPCAALVVTAIRKSPAAIRRDLDRGPSFFRKLGDAIIANPWKAAGVFIALGTAIGGGFGDNAMKILEALLPTK